MRKLLIPIIVSLPLTIICVVIASLTTEFTIWESFATLLFFPYAMLATLAYPIGKAAPLVNYLLFLQMPLYGVIIGIAWMKRHLKLTLVLLLVLHIVAAGLAIKYASVGSRGTWGVCCSENQK
jgi:uncharacterized membrane protein YfhO